MSGTVMPTGRVAAVDPRTDLDWLALASSTDGSLFTSPPWITAVCETYGFTPSARLTTDHTGRPVGGFAWVPISDMRGDRCVSMPFSDRAEPFGSDPTLWPAVVDEALCGEIPLRIRCLEHAVPVTDTRLDTVGRAAWHRTPLSPDLSEMHRLISSAARRNIATAARSGVKVEADTGFDGVRVYHRLHVALRRNKYRLLAQPLEFFERIWQEFSADDGIVTMIARVDDEPVAGAVYLVWNDTLYYKFGASLAPALPLRPNDAIFWAAIGWAVERGLTQLDWGLSDLDQPGLVAYKRKWASEERTIVTLQSRERPRVPHGGEPDRLLGELTRLLTDDAVPEHITEQAGALLYRYFS